jgi:hypothetical protein
MLILSLLFFSYQIDTKSLKNPFFDEASFRTPSQKMFEDAIFNFGQGKAAQKKKLSSEKESAQLILAASIVGRQTAADQFVESLKDKDIKPAKSTIIDGFIDEELKDLFEKEKPEDKSNDDEDNDVVISEADYKELQIIPSHGIGTVYDAAPVTLAGQAYLVRTLTDPVSNEKVLEKRKQRLQFLIGNQEFRSQLREVLAPFKNGLEADILDLGIPLDPSIKQKIDNCYFEWVSGFNTSPLKLFTKPSFNIGYGSFCIATHLFSQMVSFLGFRGLYNKIYQKGVESVNPDQELMASTSTSTIQNISVNCAAGFVICFDLGPLIQSGFSLINQISDARFIYPFMQNRVMQTKKYIEAITAVDQLIQKYPAFKESLSSASNLKNFENNSSYIKKELQGLYQTSTFKGEPSVASHWGRIARAHALVTDPALLQGVLLPALHAVGELDMLETLVEKLKPGAQGSEYSIPTYLQRAPAIHMNNAKHPNLPHAIANDFSFSREKEGNKSMVVTGVNMGGKSTAIKTFISNVLWAQSACIVRAQDVALTPFDHISIHANIHDNLGVGSKFETELNKLGDFNNKIMESPTKRRLILFDEPLSSTSATVAEPLLKSLVQYFNSYPSVFAIYVTHLHEIGKLQDEIQMSIAASENPDNTYTSTRKLQTGPSFVNDAGIKMASILGPQFAAIYQKVCKNN